MSRFRSSSAACLASALLLLASGCATPNWLNFSKSDLTVAGPNNPVMHILAMWQPASGTGIDNQPSRGFAGQVYFFAGKERLPAQVHGAIRVFEFDDQGSEQDRVKPIHQFDFPDAAWQMYLTDTKLGPCYTLFIPYMRKGFHQARCTLRVRLTPENGPPIFSDMISIVLPGNKEGDTPSTESAPPPATAATAPQRPTTAPAAPSGAAPNAVQQAAAVVADSVSQQPRRLPPDQQRQMVQQMAQYLQTTEAEAEEAEAAPPRRMKKKRPAKPVVEEDEFDDVEVVEYADEEPPARSRSRRASTRRQHPLDEDEPPRARRRVSSHPLEMDEDEPVEEVPRRTTRPRVRVESAQATPVDRMPRKSSGRVARTPARVAEPEYDDDDVEVIESEAEADEEAADDRVSARTQKSRSAWQAASKRRAPRQVIQQASAEVEVVAAPQSDVVDPPTAQHPKMQTFSIPLSPQSRALVAH